MFKDIEEVLRENEVDIENLKKLYAETPNQKIIDKSWYPEIINKIFSLIPIKPEYINFNKEERRFTILFNDDNSAEKYEELFNENVIKGINLYITEDKKENIKYYHRALVLETQTKNNTLTISY